MHNLENREEFHGTTDDSRQNHRKHFSEKVEKLFMNRLREQTECQVITSLSDKLTALLTDLNFVYKPKSLKTPLNSIKHQLSTDETAKLNKEILSKNKNAINVALVIEIVSRKIGSFAKRHKITGFLDNWVCKHLHDRNCTYRYCNMLKLVYI